MTRYLCLVLVILTLGACDRTLSPGDPLYRTWRWEKSRLSDGRLVDRPLNESSIISFQPNGTILYGKNGRYEACCFPNRFRRQADTLHFSAVNHIPVPPVDDNEVCDRLDCLPFKEFWTITTLTDSTLLLQTNFGELICTPYR